MTQLLNKLSRLMFIFNIKEEAYSDILIYLLLMNLRQWISRLISLKKNKGCIRHANLLIRRLIKVLKMLYLCHRSLLTTFSLISLGKKKLKEKVKKILLRLAVKPWFMLLLNAMLLSIYGKDSKNLFCKRVSKTRLIQNCS